MRNDAFERAMKLAVLSGLKASLGPAILKTAQRRPDARMWVSAALGEMLLDKIGVLPRRSWLPLLLPHAMSGAWVAAESMRADGIEDPLAVPMGAAVAAGVATIAPIIRGASSRVLGVPDAVMGVVEDYFALKLGSETVGLSLEDLTHEAKESLEEMKEKVMPALQSVGAGSM